MFSRMGYIAHHTALSLWDHHWGSLLEAENVPLVPTFRQNIMALVHIWAAQHHLEARQPAAVNNPCQDVWEITGEVSFQSLAMASGVQNVFTLLPIRLNGREFNRTSLTGCNLIFVVVVACPWNKTSLDQIHRHSSHTSALELQLHPVFKKMDLVLEVWRDRPRMIQ